MQSSSPRVTVATECKDAFEKMKSSKKYKFIVFKIIGEADKQWVIDCTGEADDDFMAFEKAMPEKEPRFSVYEDDGKIVCAASAKLASNANCERL